MKPTNIFRFNCDRLWKLWYSLIVTFILLMLISLGISNYITFKSQSNDPRFGERWSKLPSNLQLFAIILSFSLFLLFVYSCIFKVEHIANDGMELGIDSNSINRAFKSMSLNKGVRLFMFRLKTHLLPYNCLIHVIIALLLALPLPLLQAEQIKNEAISPEFLWTTDIDYLINPRPSSFLKEHVILCNEINCIYPLKPPAISPEFLNIVLSLLILTVRISSPFWYTNKAFSIIFSLFTFVTSLSILLEYELLVLFVKIVHNEGSEIVNVSIATRISGPMTLILSFIQSLFMMFMLIIIFEYGYTQYLSNMRNYRQYFSSDISDSVSQQSNNNQQVRWYQAAPRLVGVIVLVFIVGIKICMLHMFMEFYFKLKQAPSIVLLNLAMSVVFFIISVFLWFGLCIKNKWQFHINIQTNPISNICSRKLVGSPEPVYGCFYNATSGSSQTSLSRPMLRSSVDGSEINSFRLQSSNYVMLQSGSRVMPIRGAMEHNLGGSEASYGSQPRSFDSNDQRYRPYTFQTHNMDNSQYATLASLQSGVMLTSKALSDTSSNDTAPRGQSRRASNRVTFKEQLDTNIIRFQPELINLHNYPGQSSTPEVPDILSMNTSTLDKPSLMYHESNNPHGFDPTLEMSTDMRHGDITDCKARDPRLCSQV